MSVLSGWFDRITRNCAKLMHHDMVAEAEYHFSAEERPGFPGSPYSPAHPVRRRVGYACVALLVGITATVGNAFVTVNINNLSGALGVYTPQASLLVPIYVAMNACANLLLVKARAQFGIPAVTHVLLITYALAALLQFVFPGFASAIIIRAVNGMAAAGLTTLTIYNLLQVFPAKLRPMALVFGISIPQLGTPIARLLPIELLALDNWQGLHMMELGLALAALAVLSALPLPPSERSKVFEPLDFLTIFLLTSSIMLVCCVLGVGRVVWWTETPWLGWALAAAVPLFATGVIIEQHRKSPLLQIGWIGSIDIFRFAMVALVVRIALAEQTYGAVGLLTSGGLNNDQLHILFSLVMVGMVLGMAVSALTLSPTRLPYQVMFAALFIALGAWMDTDATNVTRPMQLYWSQSLIAFGTTLFIGPALVYGFLKMLAKGPTYLASIIVLFSMTQNIGGLAGSALLSTYQVERTRYYTAALSEHLVADDPQVVNRVQAGAGAISAALPDPALRSAQGAGLLAQSLNREANILAYNDVFRLVAMLALAVALFMMYRVTHLHFKNKAMASIATAKAAT